MKRKMTEKRIYELLGVNIFRKYVLFVWEKIWKLMHLEKCIGYRINDKTIDGLKDYKYQLKLFAISHIVDLGILIVTGILTSQGIVWWIFSIGLNAYCIMTQRYTHIRINEILEKHNKRKQKNTDNDEEINSNEMVLGQEIKMQFKITEPKTELSIGEQREQLEQLKDYVVSLSISPTEYEQNSASKEK